MATTLKPVAISQALALIALIGATRMLEVNENRQILRPGTDGLAGHALAASYELQRGPVSTREERTTG